MTNKLKMKLSSQSGLTLVEMLAAVIMLTLLSFMLHTGLNMAQRSYIEMTAQAETQVILSSINNVLSYELRYARDVVTQAEQVENGMTTNVERFTSVSYGGNTTIALSDDGQLIADKTKPMIATGIYDNGKYYIESLEIIYKSDAKDFEVSICVSGPYGVKANAEFTISRLNP